MPDKDLTEIDKDKCHAPSSDIGESGDELGIAGRVARTFIDSPLSPLLYMAALFAGLLGLLMTPRQEDPEISVPMVDLFISYEGASAEQVSNMAIDPLERIMSEIPGVKHTYTASERGQGIVTVRFKVGEGIIPSVVKVHEKLQSNMDKLPPGVSMPLVKPRTIDDVPVITVTLWSQQANDSELRILANQLLHHFERVPDSGNGFIVGGREQQLRIEVLPERLSGYGIGLDQIVQAINSANKEKGYGNLKQGAMEFRVYSGSFLKTVQDVERVVVAVRDAKPVYVRDVAKVQMGPSELENIVWFYSGVARPDNLPDVSGASAVTIAIAKKQGSNGVDVADAVQAELNKLKSRLIPDNIHVEITRNYGESANEKVNELLEALLVAAIVVSVLCLITIAAGPSFVVISVVPVVILFSIWATWLMGYSINRVSLFALIFSIGILVDDATVVVENIYRRWLAEDSTSLKIAISAVSEVGNPTIIATFAILAALIPMGFVTGMMGPYMEPIPVLGSVAMLFSLVAAFVFTPWWSVRMKPRPEHMARAEAREQKIQERTGRFYRPFLLPLLEDTYHHRGKILLIGIITAFALASLMLYSRAVPVKMLPFDNKSEFNVVINMPEGTALLATANVVQQLAEALKQVPEVKALQTYVGTASPFNFNGLVRHYYLRKEPWQADIHTMLLNKHDRSSHEIATAVRHQLTPLAQKLGARIAVVERPPGPPVLQTVVAEIHGPDAQTRREVARQMTRIFEEVPNLVDVDNYMAEPHYRWQFDINLEKAKRLGISVETINRNVMMAMGGFKLGDVKGHSLLEPIYLVAQLPEIVRADLQRVGNLPIITPQGQAIPLSELGEFIKVAQEDIIYSKDLRPIEYVVGEMEGRLGAPIYGMLAVEKHLENYTTPDGVIMSGTLTGPPEDDLHSGFEWSGEWVVTYETFRDMGVAFVVALVVIYMLLVLQFKDFILPFVIMSPIPLTLIGIIPGHWLLGAEFTATSLIGFIALAGINVRGSILLVAYIEYQLARNIDIKQAVLNAGHVRMRPIWVTNLTLMVGAGAILFDPIFQGMAISLVFGALITTLLTLLIVPLGCTTAEKSLRNSIEKQRELGGTIKP
jgi:multidrug efflux pump subunit AcrB